MAQVLRNFSFTGRVTRRQFWLSLFALLVLTLLSDLAVSEIFGQVPTTDDLAIDDHFFGDISLTGKIVLALIWIPLIWFYVCAEVRRWHDLGKSGWWLLIMFIPLGYVWTLRECGLTRGTQGANQYGPNP
jgi:uncharacterized membrane protein YhaH (DUF805 family)